MKLEDQVVSLPLAKRLKELGVKQESLEAWVMADNNDGPHPFLTPNDKGWIGDEAEFYAAFTVAELGEMLPHQLIVRDEEDRDWFDLELTKNNAQEWNLRYASDGSSPYPWMQDKSEANARTKMLIYLIEKGLVKP